MLVCLTTSLTRRFSWKASQTLISFRIAKTSTTAISGWSLCTASTLTQANQTLKADVTASLWLTLLVVIAVKESSMTRQILSELQASAYLTPIWMTSWKISAVIRSAACQSEMGSHQVVDESEEVQMHQPTKQVMWGACQKLLHKTSKATAAWVITTERDL